MVIEAFNRVHLGGTGIDRITEDEVVAVVRDALAHGRGGRIITPNVDILRRASTDPEARRHLNDADLIVADGMPLIWASRLGGEPLPERVAGSSLIWTLSAGLGRDNRSIFIIGGAPASRTIASGRPDARPLPTAPASRSTPAADTTTERAPVTELSAASAPAAQGPAGSVPAAQASAGSVPAAQASAETAPSPRARGGSAPTGTAPGSESADVAVADTDPRTGEARGGVVTVREARASGAVRAAMRLATANPGLRIAGAISPPFGFEQDETTYAEVCAQVVEARPDLVFVGLGFPKQESVIERLRQNLPSTWFVGCGAAVNFVAGDVHRAPRWMQRTGLEWAHRLGAEPRRLARRYLRHDAPYALRLLARAPRRRTLRG
ncbi:WecB/TagA/CpsF family glycosyltransferase [Actinoplanes siamensis]|uniref:N-acetylglucosaminyldiphosphoundecaprenol N-acetyl-beta-D-mannosaminyltransferase n=1 Tax=Actinoplanes siamensis TaxID=1223317 RepID=A0A919N8Y2_9ACTN|nr:WecB/TagA/CpsF family glycosyltransferase [Actinoplanes siamensis]GIF06481.1 hypothetical protein Asi03nite_40190 [Actinoplanes siamensis]